MKKVFGLISFGLLIIFSFTACQKKSYYEPPKPKSIFVEYYQNRDGNYGDFDKEYYMIDLYEYKDKLFFETRFYQTLENENFDCHVVVIFDKYGDWQMDFLPAFIEEYQSEYSEFLQAKALGKLTSYTDEEIKEINVLIHTIPEREED